jgi:hypothetical protein
MRDRDMPTLTELKDTLERTLNDPDLKTETYVRPLRQAGLLTKGGRGTSAPQVTMRDCAVLLIAIMAPFPARHAVRTVQDYALLELLRPPVGLRGQRTTRARGLRDEELAGLPLERVREVHLLGQLVEFLLLRTADGSLGRLQASWKSELGGPMLSFQLIGPRKGAILELPRIKEELRGLPERKGHNRGKQSGGRTVVLAYGPSSGSPSTPAPGLTRAAEIHEDALIALGRLFIAK